MAEPRQATISGATSGYNCRFSVRSYGSRVVRVTSLSYGVEAITKVDEAAATMVLYPLARETPSFTLELVFLSYAEREGFTAWLSTYMRRVVANQKIGGYVYVVVPARRFARNGVPIGPLPYGDQMGMLGYPVTLPFVGVHDPISSVGQAQAAGVSYYRAPSKDTAQAPAFYPSGSQTAGAESLEGTFYDPTPPDSGTVSEPGPTRTPARNGPAVPFF